MMTSFAFILGLLPSVIATGPGAAGRREIGTPVFYGMLASAVMGVFVIPMLYVVFQWLREKTGWRPPKKLIPKRERAPPLARMRCHPMAVTSGPPNGSFGSPAAVSIMSGLVRSASHSRPIEEFSGPLGAMKPTMVDANDLPPKRPEA